MTALVLNNRNFREIQKAQGAGISTAQLLRVAAFVNEATNVIVNRWHDIPMAEQEQLIRFAYSLLEPQPGLRGWWQRNIATVRFAMLSLKGHRRALDQCRESIDRLVDAILNQVETQDHLYQQTLVDTLEQISADPNQGPVLEPEDVSGWLNQLSNQALKEI